MKINYKKLSIGLLAILLIMGSYISYVWSVTPNNPFYISSGIYPASPSYTIWVEGTNYFAKDAFGVIAYSGTNISQIVISAVSALTFGGTLYFKTGLYYFDSPILIIDKYNFQLLGEEPNEYTYSIAAAKGGAILVKQFNGVLLNITYTTPGSQNQFRLTNLALWGNWFSYTGGGLYVKCGWYFKIEGCNINDFNTTGIFLETCKVFRLLHNFVQECGEDGIYLNGCSDWQMYDTEVNVNGQLVNHAAVRIVDGFGQIIGGHFEGWRGIWGASMLIVSQVYISWARENAILFQGACSILTDSDIVGGNSNSEYSGSSGCQVLTTAIGLKVSNCYISSSTATYGLALDSNCTAVSNTVTKIYCWSYNIIVDNFIYGTPKITEAGSGNTITPNLYGT